MPDDIKEVTQGMEKGGELSKPQARISPKHLLFIDHYMDKKSVADAVRAVYKCKDPSKTGNLLMKRPEIIQEITRREEALRVALLKDKPQFLLDLQDLKRRAKEKNRLDTELKAMILEADILGLTKEERGDNNIALFSFNQAKDFLESTGRMPKAEFVESSPISAQINSTIEEPTQESGHTEEGGKDKQPIADNTVSTDSASLPTINI